MAAPYYAVGTVSVSAGGTVVTGDGTLWDAGPQAIREGDMLFLAGFVAPIASVTDAAHFVLAAPWAGAEVTGSAYAIRLDGPGRLSATTTAERVRELVERARVIQDGVAIYAARAVGQNAPPGAPIEGDLYVLGTAPTGAWSGYAGHLAIWSGVAWIFDPPSHGMHALDMSSDTMWVRTTSTWSTVGGMASGVKWRGAWDAGTAYSTGDLVAHAGGSYVANAPSQGAQPPAVVWDDFVAGIPGGPGPAGMTPAPQWLFAAATADADPGNGTLRLNAASPSAVTQIYIDDLEAGGTSMAAWLDAMDDSTTTMARGTLRLAQVSDPTKFADYTVTGAVVVGAGYRKVPVAHVTGAGGFAGGGRVAVQFTRTGDRGISGTGAGDMLAAIYDPNGRASDTYDRANHTGTQAISTITALQEALDAKEASANKGAANGYAPLDSSGKIFETHLPSIAITDTFSIASQAEMLALVAQKGDIAIRSDLNKTFVLAAAPAATLANWVELRTPTNAVLSVAGRTGAITLAKGDVGLANVDNTSDANKPISNAMQTALNNKASLLYPPQSRAENYYTIQLDDINKTVLMWASGDKGLRIPPSSEIAFPDGAIIQFVEGGGGSIEVYSDAGSGITIRSKNDNSRKVYNLSPGMLWHEYGAVWWVFGGEP